jgi:Fic-DOC domain mobile mystery protein B
MSDDPLFDGDDEANTPLAPEERDGLIPSYITLRRELNEAEQVNIDQGDRWAFNPRARHDILSEEFICALHKRMYGDVWRWAGQFRTTERNIGVEPWKIAPDLRMLLDDAKYWVEHQSYRPDEIAIRFHHRLVAIHPFPNGNGRCSRLAADLLAEILGQPRFTWGSANLVAIAETRRAYVAALQAADRGDIGLLMTFARS